MSRFSEISEEEAFKVCESIESRGENLTGERLRVGLGSRGSNSTIFRILKQYREFKKQKDAVAASGAAAPLTPPSLPADAQTYIAESTKNLWEKMWFTCQSEIKTAREERDRLQVEIEERGRESEDVLTSLTSLEKENQNLIEELKHYRDLASKTGGELTALKEDLKKAKTDTESLTIRAVEADSAKRELVETRKENRELLSRSVSAEKELECTKSWLKDHENTIALKETELKELRSELLKATRKS